MTPEFNSRITPEPLLTFEAAAEALLLPLYKIRRAAKAKLFPTYYLYNKRKLVRLSEVIAAINASSETASKDDGGKR